MVTGYMEINGWACVVHLTRNNFVQDWRQPIELILAWQYKTQSFFHYVLHGLSFQQTTTILKEDNQVVLQIAQNPCHKDWIKHMGLLYCFILETIDKDKVVLVHCTTKLNIVDIFTKQLGHD